MKNLPSISAGFLATALSLSAPAAENSLDVTEVPSDYSTSYLFYDSELWAQAQELRDLARAQHQEAVESQDASLIRMVEENYRESLELTQQSLGPQSLAQIDIMKDLAKLYQDIAEYDSAIDILDGARVLTREHYGLQSREEIPLLDLLVQASVRVPGGSEVADVYHRQIYDTNVALYGEDNPAMLQAMADQAMWHQARGNLNGAHEMYEKLMHLIDVNEMPANNKSVIFKQMALVAYLDGNRKDAIGYLEEALAIVESDPFFSEEDRLAAHIDLADMSQAVGFKDEAMQRYQNIWQTMSHMPDRVGKLFQVPVFLGISRVEDIREIYKKSFLSARTVSNFVDESVRAKRAAVRPHSIGYPVPVCHAFAQEASSRGGDLSEQFVDVQITIQPDGGVTNFQALETSQASAGLVDYLKHTTYAFEFRPYMVDGVAQSKQLQFRQTFLAGQDYQPRSFARYSSGEATRIGCASNPAEFSPGIF